MQHNQKDAVIHLLNRTIHQNNVGVHRRNKVIYG